MMAQDTQDSEIWQVEMPLILGTTEDIDNASRTQNQSPTDWNRNIVVQRKSPVNVHCSLLDVVHGKLGVDQDIDTDDDGALGTLPVFHFRFVPQQHSRRVIRASIHVEFLATDAQSSPPAVCAISPYDTWTVVPTTEHEEKTSAVEGTVVTPGTGPVSASLTAKLEKLRIRDFSDAMTVSGSIEFSDDINSGECNCAAWTLLENQTRKTGVPVSLRTGILLKRETNAIFYGMVKISCIADWKTRFESMFGRIPMDDPVLFNPRLKPSKAQKKRKYNPDNLLRWDVTSVADVTVQTVFKEAITEAKK
ncbi:hypothetical protein N7451_004901 [Penicillium sp. IBT 35674x]|nr:hypothetical protein N7451_004901 [Penicillium sp. IBT 35674x]